MRKKPVLNKTNQGGMGLYAKNDAPATKKKPAKKVAK